MNLQGKLGKFGRWLDEQANGLSKKAARIYCYVEVEAELRSLTADDIVERVRVWQAADGRVDALRCGADNCHEPLKAVKTSPNDRVVLVCPQCHRVEEDIPREVLLAYELLRDV